MTIIKTWNEWLWTLIRPHQEIRADIQPNCFSAFRFSEFLYGHSWLAVVSRHCPTCCVCSGPCNETGTGQESHRWPSLHLLLPLMSSMNSLGIPLCHSVLKCAISWMPVFLEGWGDGEGQNLKCLRHYTFTAPFCQSLVVHLPSVMMK